MGDETDAILARCEERGLRMTGQRKVIVHVLARSGDHPDAETLHQRAAALDPGVSLATVYRTVRLLEESGILDRRDFRDGRARFEDAERAHHDHLIDVNTGEVIEFVDKEIERLQHRVAQKLGYRLLDHRLELFGQRIDRAPREREDVGDDKS